MATNLDVVAQAFGQWTVTPPTGLTDAGRIRRFQDRTVVKMKARMEEIAQPAYEELVRTVRATYQEGTGELADNLMYSVEGDRDSVQVRLGMRTGVSRDHIVYLTALAGAPLVSQGHDISPHGPYPLRFFWKHPSRGGRPGVYALPHVFWRPHKNAGDVIAEVVESHRIRFEQEMIRLHETALAEFVQENAQPATRSPRVTVINMNEIAPI